MNERSQTDPGAERTTTADLAGRTSDQQTGMPGTATGQPPAAANGGNGSRTNPASTGNGHTAVATETEEATRAPLLQKSDADSLHGRWTDVQANFVDDPRRAVQDADALVAELMQRLAKMFADERSKLEQEWDRGGEVSTEDLRTALRRYRSFFERLLSV